MSCVESGGQKAAPKIFAGAEQIPPPTAVSQQSRDSDEGRCERAAPVQLLLWLRNLIYRPEWFRPRGSVVQQEEQAG